MYQLKYQNVTKIIKFYSMFRISERIYNCNEHKTKGINKMLVTMNY